MSEVRGVLRTPEEARSFGVALGRLLRAGDLVLLTHGDDYTSVGGTNSCKVLIVEE